LTHSFSALFIVSINGSIVQENHGGYYLYLPQKEGRFHMAIKDFLKLSASTENEGEVYYQGDWRTSTTAFIPM